VVDYVKDMLSMHQFLERMHEKVKSQK